MVDLFIMYMNNDILFNVNDSILWKIGDEICVADKEVNIGRFSNENSLRLGNVIWETVRDCKSGKWWRWKTSKEVKLFFAIANFDNAGR